jgi:S1-C subfamily serine protease
MTGATEHRAAFDFLFAACERIRWLIFCFDTVCNRIHNSTQMKHMLIRLSSFVILCIGQLANGFAQGPSSSVSEVVRHSADAVVLIVISDASGKEIALGSGFIISTDGRIVTNYHVIKDAKSAIVKLTNGASFTVDGIIAANSEKDLAIIKVPGRNLAHLEMANTGSIQIGDHVVAIGSPLGLEGSVSDGIISAIRDEGSNKWLQTTAPVSHGNSGGPLLDMNGNIVGVITWGVNTQYGQNLNFAVPSDTLQAVLATSHAVISLGSSINNTPDSGKKAPSSIEGVWTSMTTGRDYKLRREGDYIYSEWVNLPSQLQGTAAFTRSELKKDSDGHWRGKAINYAPFQYYDIWTKQQLVKWCRVEATIELTLISDSRIEGTGTAWEKFDVKKCQPKETKQQSFTWIPKN